MTELTKLNEAIRAVNAKFNYIADGKSDSWDVTAQGDCEDYSFAVLWVFSGKSRLKFAKNILFGPFSFWFVRVSGDGHFMTEYKPTGELFDNNWKQLVSKDRLATSWVLKHKYWKLRVLLKIAFT